jgi:hypothetical protein
METNIHFLFLIPSCLYTSNRVLFVSVISLTHKTLRTGLHGETVQVADTSTVQIVAQSVGEYPVCIGKCLNVFYLKPSFGIAGEKLVTLIVSKGCYVHTLYNILRDRTVTLIFM